MNKNEVTLLTALGVITLASVALAKLLLWLEIFS